MDDFGIVYIIENAQQFWAELEDILHIPPNASLGSLDSSLKRFVSFCASYHEQFLQSPLQLEHACDLVLDSELFAFHSERMCEILSDEALANTDPHAQLILYNVLLQYGRRNSSFLRSHKRWQPLLPLLMDHVLVAMDPDIEDTYTGSASGPSTGWKASVIPIEAKLRSLSVRLMYEVCRASKMSISDLKVFSDDFIDQLFELVEQTRNMHDESFNYSVIKLIVALNEQFMVAALKPSSTPGHHGHHGSHGHDTPPEDKNRVLTVLKRRLGSSQTFGENMIFMLNRAGRSPEDLVMQLLVLKILYILFTTKEMCEYFYTNDLCVLVDVFLREIVDLDEDSESLRHTYLRVLHPLLTKTQLRNLPYKRPQILRALEQLVENPEIRDVSATTKRLVERCLSGEWCVHLRTIKPKSSPIPSSLSATDVIQRNASPNIAMAQQNITPMISGVPERAGLNRQRSLKGSRSAENLRSATASQKPAHRGIEVLRKPTNDSASSLPGVAIATTPASSNKRRDRVGSANNDHAQNTQTHEHQAQQHPLRANSLGTSIDGLVSGHSHTTSFAAAAAVPIIPESAFPAAESKYDRTSLVPEPMSPASVMSFDSRFSTNTSSPSSPSLGGFASSDSTAPTISRKKSPPPVPHRRSAPAPPKRRKPPAVPVHVGTTNGGARISAIASSTSVPTISRAGRTGA